MRVIGGHCLRGILWLLGIEFSGQLRAGIYYVSLIAWSTHIKSQLPSAAINTP